jgi:bifunctional DNA-binding transcriptional regulator/antitoxin component of YhaV-PrlF toxin-antitoxin module
MAKAQNPKQPHWFKSALIRRLTKIGGASYGVTLPIEVVRQFRWQKRQKLQLTIDEENKRIIIEDWKG